jgi:N-acetylgalactosamine kinase
MTAAPGELAAAVCRQAPAGMGPLVLVRAPGRVNLIGEHTDYNGLPVLPMAIDRAVYAAARALAEPRVTARNLDTAFPASTFACAADVAPSAAGSWESYLKAAVRELAGGADARGLALVVAADLPRGAGLSSSSALVVATALALSATRGQTPARLELAERLARAERFVGTLSGGMDQAVILLAEAGSALRIDFFPLRVRPVALPAAHAIVVCDSLERAEKSAGARTAYNRRVVECRLATRVLARALGVPLARLGDLARHFPAMPLPAFVDVLAAELPDRPLSLAEIARHCDATEAALAPLLCDADGRPLAIRAGAGFHALARARHVLAEAARVDAAEQALIAGDPARLGALMSASHASCREAYGISTPALEVLVATAERAGALGARLTGAGFGGCTVNLVPSRGLEAFLARLDADFYRPRLPAGAAPDAHRFVVAPAAAAEVTQVPPLVTPADGP